MYIHRRSFMHTACAAGVLAAVPAWAQNSPTRIAVGFAAGGTVDVVARRLAERLRGDYAETVVVENRAGAGGRLALEWLKQAPADGSAIALSPSSMVVVYPHVYTKLSYDPLKDLLPVVPVCANALAFVVGPAVPAQVKSLPDFVAWVRSGKDAFYATPAAGSMLHFLGLVFGQQAGITLTHVPYRGMAPAIQDLLGGAVTSCLGTLGDFLPHMASGRLRALAVTSPQRSRFMPTVPTFSEQGYGQVVGMDWFGLFLPARSAPGLVGKLRSGVDAALQDKAMQETLDQIGMEPLRLTPADFSARIQQETRYWAPIVKASGFSSDS